MTNSEPPPQPCVELLPGTPFCSLSELNRISRQQGLCLAIAQAWVLDEIQHAISLDPDTEHALIHRYLEQQGIEDDPTLERYLQHKGWNQDDLTYFATKGYRLSVFKQRMFRQDLEIRFLERKLDLDQVEYSLIRVSDSDLAFELHQRLVEGEASFAELASSYSEGAERERNGRVGPVPLTQAHPDLAEKLRISQPGQLWPPFRLQNIWLIVKLEQLHRSQLDDQQRRNLIDELHDDWMQKRVMTLLRGQMPEPLPLHLLSEDPLPSSEEA